MFEFRNKKVSDADHRFQKLNNGPNKTILKPSNENNDAISFFQLFRYATKVEFFLLFLGSIFSAIRACALPSEIVIYGEFTSMLVDRTYRSGTSSKTYLLPILGGGKILTNASREENNAELYNDSLAYGGLLMSVTIILFITGIFAVDIFNYVALKQVTRIRIEYFTATMRQDISWHDITKNQNIALRITDDIEKIRNGISEKISQFLILFVGFIISTVTAFIYGWKLSLAIGAYIPVIFLTNFFISKYQSKLTNQELNSYARAGSLLEEILSGIRTVIAFGGEKSESQRYDDYLVDARKAVVRKGAFTGFSAGVLNGLLFISTAVAFRYGIYLILADRDNVDKEYTPAILMIVIFGLICGAFNIGRCSPYLESFATARGSASSIFDVIDSLSNIDPLSNDGIKPNSDIKGDIIFENVFFTYPSRDDVTVLNGININIESGKTIALVGSSGCGKSTCIQLLQRFYDPVYGQILLDNTDIRKYNISWLRSNIAVVGQEPVLFQGTISDNIKHGKQGATKKEIVEAAKSAGAHDFINTLPEDYETLIGEKGTQLSGGQKQRIAIARALIQNSKILLLDEATSALDYKSEKYIQDALDAASKNRTTIVVSHRLSAIKGADKIFFIENGNVIEEGSPEDLLKLNGRYKQMVTSNQLKMLTENDIEEDKTNNIGRYDPVISTKIEANDIRLENLAEFDSLTDEDKLEKVGFTSKSINYYESFKRILKISKPIRARTITAVVFSLFLGATFPTFSIFLGDFYGVLAESDKDIAYSKSATLSNIFCGIGVTTAFICFMQLYFLNNCGGWIAAKIKSLTLKSILRQDIGWFDLNENSVGSLSARLSGNAANIQGAIGSPLGEILQGISQITLSVIAAMFYSQELTLICMTLIPIMVGANVIEARLTTSTALEEKKALEEASSFATEAVHNIRTVAALRREKEIIEQFTKKMIKVQKFLKYKLRYRGLVNSFGHSLMYFGYSIILSYGGVLVSREEIVFQNIIKVAELLLFGSISFAQSLIFAPAMTSALIAGHQLFEIIDHNPEITSPDIVTESVNGSKLPEVEYKAIDFSYPTRPEITILRGLNLKVQAGKTIALVGHSGCGKSTCIQLLQRFYDASEGVINLNRKNIKTEMTLETLRSELGIVSQEPVLFERTISENIAYGDNNRTVSMVEIIEASKQANAHSFITTLPLGYDTPLGARGTQLSGGQKQRIAIARALVRNPKVLLLDEATSALDIKSEKVVQEALDVACSGRTCIVIAHRLSTIQNADLIFVFVKGKIAEQGTHQQLITQNGVYTELCKLNENV